MNTQTSRPMLEAPFPWFGGKRRVAHLVWPRFGVVRNYVEPFFGSGAMLLNRPAPWEGVETINDLDGFVANFWRSIRNAPDETARHADHPVNENDLHARHAWLVGQREILSRKLEGDPDYYAPKIAGWWAWGICTWIGSGFCAGAGPWAVNEDRQLVYLGNGQGVNRQRVYLGSGQGVNRQLVHLGDHGRGLMAWFSSLSDRIRHVRVCCGEWARVCGPSVTWKHGPTAVFLDPPYADTANRSSDLYRCDSESIAHDVREWAIANGDHPLMRIALCGYEGEHQMPGSWSVVSWSSAMNLGEISNGNRHRERIWFSPHCLKGEQGTLF